MNRLSASLILAVLVLLGLPAAAPLHAEQLTMSKYFEVTLGRLTMAVETLETDGRALTEEEEAALFQRHGTSAKAYYSFASEHREEMAAYLEEHPEIEVAVNELSARIQQLVAQAEER